MRWGQFSSSTLLDSTTFRSTCKFIHFGQWEMNEGFHLCFSYCSSYHRSKNIRARNTQIELLPNLAQHIVFLLKWRTDTDRVFLWRRGLYYIIWLEQRSTFDFCFLFLCLPHHEKHVKRRSTPSLLGFGELVGCPWAWWSLSWHEWRTSWCPQTDPLDRPQTLLGGPIKPSSGTLDAAWSFVQWSSPSVGKGALKGKVECCFGVFLFHE